jgi:hypothetical protein
MVLLKCRHVVVVTAEEVGLFRGEAVTVPIFVYLKNKSEFYGTFNVINPYCRKLLKPNLRYYPGFRVARQRKITKILCQESRYKGRDLNPGPPVYETKVPNTLQRRLVELIHVCFHMV